MHPQVQETQDRNSAVQTCALNQLLDPDRTRVSHPAVTTTYHLPSPGVSHSAVSILVLHTYIPSSRHHSHRSVSPSGEHPHTPHLYPVVGITHTGVSLPPVSTLIHYTASAGHIDPVGVTQTLESNTDTREIQTALIVRLPHLPTLTARRPVGGAAAAACSWTRDSNHGRYHRRKRAKRRKHHHRAHRHRSMDDWLNPAASGSIPCAPPLSRQLQHAIQRGKCVSFSKLLLPHNTPPIINPIKTKPHPKKTK